MIMSENLRIAFELFGGLAIFIFGMNMMSEGLQKIAGEKMRHILSILTRNPVMGVLAGGLATAVLQSSSATTVMVIGFVSAGLMPLPQAISVILGANIGTTLTAQIIAFKITDYIWPLVFIGFLVYFLAKKERTKYIGQSIFAFGLLFVGLNTMGDVMKPLAKSPVFTDLFAAVSDSPIFGVGLGAAMTLVVQSSSATIAVLQNFASQPLSDGATSVLGLNNSIPILLGDNIGTTITALLATLGQSKNAKRTAAAHSVFNISGSLIFLCVIPYFADFIRFISPTGAEVDVIARQIANAHTAFNIINTIIWLPFIWLMVKIVMWLVPGEDKAVKHEESKPKYLDDKLISQPAIALHMAALEIMRCGVTGEEAIRDLKSAMINNNRESLEKIARSIVGIHLLQEKIAHYISSMLSSGSLTHEQARQTAGLMHMISDIGRISNRCKEILEIATEKMSGEHFFSSRANKELGEGFDLIAKMLGKSLTALSLGAKPMAEEVMEQRDTVSALEMKLRNKHLLKLELGDSNEQKAQMFISSMHNIERIGYHCLNLSESVLDGIDMTFLIKNRADYDEVAE
jgi:phosphate:Na+ symporter